MFRAVVLMLKPTDIVNFSLRFIMSIHRSSTRYSDFVPDAGTAFQLLEFVVAVTAPLEDRPDSSTAARPIASPSIETAVPHAPPQICMLTVPSGALGNDSSHSTCHGNQPGGSANIGCFE